MATPNQSPLRGFFTEGGVCVDKERAMTAQKSWQQVATSSLKAFAHDTARGFFDITHNGLALMGMLLAVGLITLGLRADLRDSAEQRLLGWLLNRQTGTELLATDPTAADRVSAVAPNEL